MRTTLIHERYREVVALRKEGYTLREISEKTGVTKSTVHRWLTIFAGENISPMETGPEKRIIGKEVPSQAAESSPNPAEDDSNALREQVARLEKELKEARMRADLYEEIINVAERKFNISIRKKAGTRQ